LFLPICLLCGENVHLQYRLCAVFAQNSTFAKMRRYPLFILVLVLVSLVACHTTKYVPKDQYLLRKVKIKTDRAEIKGGDLSIYLNQVPNERFLGLMDMNLAIYNLSGQDTSKWINRTLRNIGEAPVIFDEAKNERSAVTLQNLLVNQGYYHAEVTKEVRFRKRFAYVTLNVRGNMPYTIRRYSFQPTKDTIGSIIQKAVQGSPVRAGMLLSSDKLEEERTRLVEILQRQGYYDMQRDYFSMSVDSTLGTNQADVVLEMKPYYRDTLGLSASRKAKMDFSHPVYRIRHIYFMLDVPMSSFAKTPGSDGSSNLALALANYDTLVSGAYRTIYQQKPFISPDALIDNCRILPGEIYDANTVERTYSRMSSLQYMKFINIRFAPDPTVMEGERPLDCYIVLTRNDVQGLGFDVEGTNTAGDLGIAGNINYTHRNLLNGSELFQAKIRGAYEALSTSLGNKYTELGAELNLTLPEFKMLFLKNTFKRNVDATTELTTTYQVMSRPEFERTVASVGMRYNWSRTNLRQTIDLFDLSYVYLPWVDASFKATYLNDSSYLKYSYEDHFILRTAYSFSYSSVPFGTTNRTYYTWKGSIESAGNALWLGYRLAGAPKDENGFYKIGNINFSQYIRGELEYARSKRLNSRSRIAYRAGLGLGYPFGNSDILPFEKRFYSGGANSVRGWSVRTLGPGSYNSGGTRINFMNQSGDVKLDLSLEYRGTLFWVVEGALFADAGNIWTLRYYDEQPGGQFRFDSFYKQMAGSVGAGIRFAFDFFLIRADLGMKVYDPSSTLSDHWRIKSIDNWDDFALHIAVGYPF
jgi:outer membrane protein assembly factor BamA